MMTMTTKTNRASRTSAAPPVTVTADGLLLLPRRDVAVLAQLVWQDDRAERDRFVKTARRGISIDEFQHLVYRNNMHLVFGRLGESGSFQKVADWYLDQKVAQERRTIRDLIWENFILKGHLPEQSRNLKSRLRRMTTTSVQNKELRYEGICAAAERTMIQFRLVCVSVDKMIDQMLTPVDGKLAPELIKKKSGKPYGRRTIRKALKWGRDKGLASIKRLPYSLAKSKPLR
jgi:hypothetical protein